MAVNNSLARQDQSMKLSVYLQNDAVKKQINQVVGGKNGTRFISSIVSAVQSTPALQECTSPSIVNAALLGEALNLSPSPQLGQFYMVPFDNKKKGCKEAQFKLGYKGYIQLAIRSGYYKKLNVLAIKEGELLNCNVLWGVEDRMGDFVQCHRDRRRTGVMIGCGSDGFSFRIRSIIIGRCRAAG